MEAGGISGATTRTHAVPGGVRMSRGVSFQSRENGFHLRLPGGPAAAATARQALGQLRGDFDEPTMETLRLLVTELVANSVRHTDATDVAVRAVVTGSAVWLEVCDEGPGFERDAAVSEAAHNEESGWGLFLVERLAHRWGVRREGGATYVWFELRR